MLVWLAMAAVTALALLPLAWFVLAGGRLRGRQDAALALHRAQLAELDRDLAENRLLPAEHAGARLEVQRRLLAEAEGAEPAATTGSPFLLVMTAALVPAVAVLIYAGDGGMPDYRARAVAAAQSATDTAANSRQAADAAVIEQLRAVLPQMDQHADKTRSGYVLLGNGELQLGRLAEAAAAWRRALDIRFDPALGAETAEAMTEAEARVSPQAAALFQRALAEAPPDVPWRRDAEKRLAEAKAKGAL